MKFCMNYDETFHMVLLAWCGMNFKPISIIPISIPVVKLSALPRKHSRCNCGEIHECFPFLPQRCLEYLNNALNLNI